MQLLNGRSHDAIAAADVVLVASAASILAKVARDREMQMLHEKYPCYGFDAHKGYGTAVLRVALQAHGVSPVHRRSYAPVTKLLFKNK